MKYIDLALTELTRTFNYFNIKVEFEKASPKLEKWPIQLKTSMEVEYFFENYNPINVRFETGFCPLEIFSIDKIEKAQIGYKWINKNGELTPNPKWNSNLIIIMDDLGGGKPIIAKIDEPGTPVYASYDIKEPFKVADSLPEFF